MSKTILVTGGAGYIGSHCILSLLENGFEVVALDNFANSAKGKSSKPESLLRVELLTSKKVTFYEVDIQQKDEIRQVFKENAIDCVVHVAALKSVSESCSAPIKYYETNLTGSTNLISVMNEFNVKKLVFSSSSTVFGEPHYLPIDEEHPTGSCISPYGRTKYFVEEIVKDICDSDKTWGSMLLRYFNPVGAHPSGVIGEDPLGVPYNLVPYIAQVSVGRREKLMVYGTDYPTKDGTCVRDYIHIVDLAEGHVAALKKMFDNEEFSGAKIYNLSTGSGASVLDVIKSFEKASQVKIPVEYTARRSGDIPISFSKCEKAELELGWKAKKSLDQMCEDVWRWQSKNPMGYETAL